MKRLNFPNFRQTFDYDCGAKVMHSILAYFGIDKNQDEIMKIAKTDQTGTSIRGIEDVAKHFNLRCDSRSMNSQEVIDYLERRVPVILLLQAWSKEKNHDYSKDWDNGHYVVAIGYDKKKIYFEDPYSLHRTYLDFSELENRWHDQDNRTGEKFIRHAIAIYGKKPRYEPNKSIHME